MGERLKAAVHHRWAVLLVATVVVVDQATKALAGHGYLGGDEWGGGYIINPAAGTMIPDPLHDLWAQPVLGAVLDLVNLALVAALVIFALRLRGLAQAGVLTFAAGESSNLLDRFGLSYLTAPVPHGRGVVDPDVLHNYNVADYAINAGLYLLLAAAFVAAAKPTLRALRRALRRLHILRWRSVLSVVAMALLGVWVGTVGQYGQVRAARQDARTWERYATQPEPTPKTKKAPPEWVSLPTHEATLTVVRRRCGGREPLYVTPVDRRLWVHCRGAAYR